MTKEQAIALFYEACVHAEGIEEIQNLFKTSPIQSRIYMEEAGLVPLIISSENTEKNFNSLVLEACRSVISDISEN